MQNKAIKLFKMACLSACFAIQSFVYADTNLLDLNQYKGQTVYLDFWASWCVPCKKSFPWMQQMQSKYRHMGLQVIAVNLDENSADADRFLSQFNVDFEVIKDPKGILADKYSLKAMPSALLFNAQGELVSRHTGFNRKKQAHYEASLKKALMSYNVSMK